MDEIIERLREKDENAAYEFAKKIGIESAESDECEIHVELLWWKMIENIFFFLKSLVR